MDRRTLVALVLMALVIVVTPRFFKAPPPPVMTAADSTALAATATNNPAVTAPAGQPAATTPPTIGPGRQTASPAPVAAPVVAESVTTGTPRAQLTLVSPGAAPLSVHLGEYNNLRPGARSPMVVSQVRGPLLRYRLVRGADTVALDTVRFAVTKTQSSVEFRSSSPSIGITYQPVGDSYRTSVRGVVANAPEGATLLIDLPNDFRSSEADTLDDMRHFAYAYRIAPRDPTSVTFNKLDTAARSDTGAMQWVSARDKYWIVALVKPDQKPTTPSFHNLVMRGDPANSKTQLRASATTALAVVNGTFGFDLYAGPQSWQELHALSNELENVNQYAGFFHPVVQPFATIVMRVLLWMRSNLKLTYGWVLVLFGVSIRLLMWPLNQKAMRTSIQMQRLQPELTAVQTRYKDDPEKQRTAIMKVYSDHGMSPFSPILGCLPMLLPMPVLWALYFVFQNTIEFRGVQFLWLPDISLRDPYYITPIVMGVSMFLLSWIGMRSVPPNPQTKMMSYMMPVMFTVMFLNFASGLNLYYAVQNIAALPQQWLVSRERARAGIVSGSGGGGSGGKSVKRSG